jgi:hypothetical protein
VIGIESSIDRIFADRKYFLHVRNAVLEDQGFAVVGYSWNSAGWRQTVYVAIEKFEVKKVLEGKR